MSPAALGTLRSTRDQLGPAVMRAAGLDHASVNRHDAGIPGHRRGGGQKEAREKPKGWNSCHRLMLLKADFFPQVLGTLELSACPRWLLHPHEISLTPSEKNLLSPFSFKSEIIPPLRALALI